MITQRDEWIAIHEGNSNESQFQIRGEGLANPASCSLIEKCYCEPSLVFHKGSKGQKHLRYKVR